MSNQLGLLALTAAADVVAAECRYNDLVFNHVKKSDLSREQWLAFLDSREAVVSSSMADFKSHRFVERNNAASQEGHGALTAAFSLLGCGTHRNRARKLSARTHIVLCLRPRTSQGKQNFLTAI